MFGGSSSNLLGGGSRHKANRRDVEAADFNEAELDDLHVEGPHEGAEEGRYSLGEVSSDGEDEKRAINGHPNGKIDEKGNLGEP